MEAEDFLELVWDERECWVDLPAKVGAYWVPYYTEWEGDADEAISRRIDSCLRDGESLYFSVAQFKKRGRRIEDTLPLLWLWADLDEIKPAEAIKAGLAPTIAWESSPGRYQALWRLNRELSPRTQAKLNQALSYFLGADHGGWDLTQVLRLPGTRNFKYPEAPMVTLLFHTEGLSYDPKYIWEIVKGAYPGGSESGGVDRPRRAMPAECRALLRVPADAVVEGERSAKLWRIYCLLAEAGWGEDDIYVVASESAWNKWANVSTGETRMRAEIRKALHHVRRRAALADAVEEVDETHRPAGDEDSAQPTGGSGAEASTEEDESVLPLPWVRYSSFMAMTMEEPRWLIQDIWTAGSHGILGGEPKTSKTTLALAMALSVASGKPFLGKHRVGVQGPVLMVQEENAPWMMQDRLRKLAHYYGLLGRGDVVEEKTGTRLTLGRSRIVSLEFPNDLPLRLLNNHGLDLTQEDDRMALWEEVADVRPALVILDPLYLLFAGVNTDKAHELAPYFKWLLALRNTFGCAVMLIHHFRKQQGGGYSGGSVPAQRAGQRLMGNATLHGFVDSALYASALDLEDKSGWVGARVEREFRSMAPQKPLEIEMALGQPGALDMQTEIRNYDVMGLIERIVREDPGVTVRAMEEMTGLDRRTILGRCRDAGFSVVGGKKGRGHSWQLYLPGTNGDGDA